MAQVSAIGFVIIKAIYTHYGQINIFLVFFLNSVNIQIIQLYVFVYKMYDTDD